ncbi:hypothetical protein N9937_01380 [bacterium]|nr:hypothetical protein [bacterium]
MVINFWLVGELPDDGLEVSANRYAYRNVYRRGDDLSDFVALREAIYDSPTVICWGMWHYDTGEPVGGVGSPWFQTPPDKAGDFDLLTGQHPRAFI